MTPQQHLVGEYDIRRRGTVQRRRYRMPPRLLTHAPGHPEVPGDLPGAEGAVLHQQPPQVAVRPAADGRVLAAAAGLHRPLVSGERLAGDPPAGLLQMLPPVLLIGVPADHARAGGEPAALHQGGDPRIQAPPPSAKLPSIRRVVRSRSSPAACIQYSASTARVSARAPPATPRGQRTARLDGTRGLLGDLVRARLRVL